MLSTSLMFNARVDLCGGTLRPARPNSSLLPSRQAVPEDRDMLPNVGVLGKLLLEERCKLFANEQHYCLKMCHTTSHCSDGNMGM